jgi:hypothetical protein
MFLILFYILVPGAMRGIAFIIYAGSLGILFLLGLYLFLRFLPDSRSRGASLRVLKPRLTNDEGERLDLKILSELEGESAGDMSDVQLAAATKLSLDELRDWLETLEDMGFVERARGTERFSTYITAKGKQALRMAEPISIPTTSAAGSASVAMPTASDRPTTQANSLSPKTTGPVRLFYSYSHKDEALRDRLEEALALLRREGLISDWQDRKIGAGAEWKGAIDKNFEEAQVVLLLVSASFIASDYCWDIELKQAIERHDLGEARVIPIILRPCDWHGAPFGKLQPLPKDGKPIIKWRPRDDGFKNVADGIRQVIKEITANPQWDGNRHADSF